MKFEAKVRYYRRCENYDRILRRIRLKVFDYRTAAALGDCSQVTKSNRIIRRIKKHNRQRDLNRRPQL